MTGETLRVPVRLFARVEDVFARPWAVPLALALAGAVPAQTWFRSGKVIASGDNLPAGFLDPDGSFADAASLWSTSTTPTGGADYYPALEMLPALLGKMFALAGLGPEFAQRAFLTLLFASLAPAMFLLLRRFLPERRHVPAVATGSLFYAYNPALFVIVPNAVLLAALVLLPLLPALVLRSSRASGWRLPALFAAATLPLSYVFHNPPAFALVVVAILAAAAAAIVAGPRRPAALFLVRAGALATLVNVWWLVPVALVTFGSPVAVSEDADAFAWAWTHSRSSLDNVMRLTPTWGWLRPEYFPYSATLERTPFVVLAFVPAAATAAAVVVARSRRGLAIVVTSAAVVVALLAKGLHPPLVSLNSALYRHGPGMWLFREPAAKFTPVLAGVFAIGIALFLASLERRWLRRGAYGVVALAIVATSYPLWSGQVVPSSRPLLPSAHVRIPSDWTAAAVAINREPGPTLLLPANDYYQMPYRWGFYGADTLADELIEPPVIRLLDPKGSTYLDPDPSAVRMLTRLREQVEAGSLEAAVPLMRALGVKWVLLRRDVDPRFPGRRIQDPDRLAASIAGRSDLRKAATFGALELYELHKPLPGPVWASTNVVQVAPGSEADAPFDLPLGDAPAIVSAPTPGVQPRSLQVVEPDAWRRTPAGWAAALPPAGEQSSGYARWSEGLLVHLRREPIRDLTLTAVPAVVGHAPARLPFRSMRIPTQSAAGHVAVTLNGHLVAFPRAAGEQRLVLRPGRNSLTIRKAVPSSALRDPSFERGTWGSVGDCYAHDGRSPQEVGISAARVRRGDGFALALSAREHAACVSQAIAGFRPGIAYRLTLDYANISGTVARLCVWQDGPNRCLALPALRASGGWHRAAVDVRPEQGTRSLQLFLYADGDGTGTRALYDDVRVEEYRVVARRTPTVSSSWQPQREARGHVTVAAGAQHELLRDPSFEEGTWSAVGDCNAIDPRSIPEVGIAAARVRRGGGHALALTAREHSACVSQQVSGFRPGRTYRVSLEYRVVRGLPARLCLWQDGPQRCAALPDLRVGAGWQHADLRVRPDAGTTGLRLFLYADGDGTGTRVLYDNVRVERRLPLPELVSLASTAGAAAPLPVVTVKSAGRTTYRAQVAGAKAPFLLVLSTTFDAGWSLSGAPTAAHVRVNGFANGWIVDGRGDFTITLRWKPQRWVSVARGVSMGGIALLPLLLLAWPRLPSLPAIARRLPRPRRRQSVPVEIAHEEDVDPIEEFLRTGRLHGRVINGNGKARSAR